VLRHLRHPNVVNFQGVCVTGESRCGSLPGRQLTQWAGWKPLRRMRPQN